jgi:hypothetical protein
MFRLPETIKAGNAFEGKSPATWPKVPLAYIEWYAPLLPNPDKYHGMYTVRKQMTKEPQYSIIPISNIRQSCMLIPNFGKSWPKEEWTSDTVLDKANSFLLNNWQSLFAYQSLW